MIQYVYVHTRCERGNVVELILGFIVLSLILAILCWLFVIAIGAIFFSDARNPFYNEEVEYDDE